jgi:ParB family chromosome partitioning protein
MARNNALNFNLPSVDDLFSTEESRAEARLEKVVNLNPSEISDFPDHPFKVRMDYKVIINNVQKVWNKNVQML